MVSNTVENIAIGAGSAAATYAAVEAWRRASERTVLDGKTVRSTRVDAARLSADADTFQFKSGGDRSGVTDRLAGVKTWNAAAAGKVMVYEYADGRQVIADGHQRTGLAKRLMGDGHAPIKMDALVLREADGWSPRDVRAYAAIKNMHESSGNALDMAKIMRERPDLVTSSLPMSDAKVREASALSRLSDKAFGMVVGGGVEPGAAAAVGEAVKDATRHADMIAEMSEAKVRGAQHARLYVQQALSAPSVAETTSSLFGEETHTRSLIKERSAVLDRALTSLKSNRKLFGMLEREADTIEAAGNKLARQANSSNADTAGRLSARVEKLATQRGNVSKMLDDAARAVASGEPAAKAGRAFLKSVQGAMEHGGIRALVGDAPLPMAASGGMQRMVEKPKDIEVGRTYISRRKGQYTVEKVENGKVHVDVGGTKLAYDERQFREQIMSNNQSRPGKATQSSFLPAPTTKEQTTAAAKSAGKPGVMQQDVGGLFGDGMKQMDLVDEARKNAARDANVKLVQDKWLADRGITSLDQVKSMTQPERENLAREWEKVSKPIDRKGPVGWSDAAREGSAKSRGVALPGEAKPVVPVKAGKAKGAPKPTAKGAKILDLYHGTAAPKFDTFKSGNSDGMRGGAPYLTSDYKAAERYAKMAAERTGGTPRVLRVQVEAEKVMSTGSNWMKQSQISGLMKRVLGREVGMKAFDDFARTSVTGPPGNKGAQGATVYKSLADAVGGANALNERLAKAGVTAVKFDQPAAFWGNTSYNIRDAVAVLDPSRARIVDQDYRPAPKAKAPSAAPKAPKAPPVAQLRADAAKAGIPAAAQMKKPELMSLKKAGKFMGPLAIIGAGAVAFDATRNQAHAAGKSESAANLDAAGAAAIASGSVAAIGYGIGKVVQAAARVAPVAGKVLARAVPVVAVAAAGYEIGKGAVAGFKKDGLAGAAKGAGVGAMDFATLGAYSHFASKGQMGRLTPEQESQFASADQGYRAGQEQQKAAATTDDGSGWTDQARIAAYMKRIANAGGTPQNMPYGGKPRQTPASSGTWAQANVAVPGGPAKGKN
jgi:hypothetical protein